MDVETVQVDSKFSEDVIMVSDGVPLQLAKIDDENTLMPEVIGKALQLRFSFARITMNFYYN